MIVKLIYLIVIGLENTFAVGVLIPYMQTPHQIHWDAACRVLWYLKEHLVEAYLISLLSSSYSWLF